jgi:UDP-glucose 4-epimerase
VSGTLNLLETMRKHGVDRLVFSSTAAVFGHPNSERIDEDHPKQPINPYGASKLMVERILADAAGAYGLRSVALRYFNAAGASPRGDDRRIAFARNAPDPQRAARRARLRPGAQGVRRGLRDARRHLRPRLRARRRSRRSAPARAGASRRATPGAHAFNLGNGQGFSVREVIAARRSGERPRSRSRSSPAARATPRCWSPQATRRAPNWLGPAYDRLEPILETALRWHRDQPSERVKAP